MRRALRGAVGVLVAVATVVPASSALAKFPFLRVPGESPQPRQVVYDPNFVLSESQRRLEEIKVELALLADPATFPFYLGARAAGEFLILHGYVPDEKVRQHALNLARRGTFLRVCDKLLLQPNLIATPPQRLVAVLHQQAVELLQQNLGKPALAMSIRVRPDRLIVVSGSIDSVENKLAVSRLFRRLSGCRGVVNELIVQPILPSRPPVVQVALQSVMVKPPLPLDAKPQPPVESPPSVKPVIPASPSPTSPPLPLPVVVPVKAAIAPPKVVLTLPVKILVDQAEPTVQTVWEKRLRQRIREASEILEPQCGVRLELIEVGMWESNAKQTKLSELREDFQKKAALGKARLAIGFTGLPASQDETALGCTLEPLHPHILIREWKPHTEPERLEALVHELGHFLGACHSPDRDSVMRPQFGDGRVNFRAFRLGFDEVNAQVMSLVAEELAGRPIHGLEELSPRTRKRLFDLYLSLARTMPNDPALAGAIRQLEGMPLEPLSARQLSPKTP